MSYLFGALNVEKPKGKTSHDVVALLRRVLKIKKIGHGGTLDPMATGVLPILVGGATRLMDYIANREKTYVAEIFFGKTTDTLDAEGRVTSEKNIPLDIPIDFLEKHFSKWTGEIRQRVPKYSAVRCEGQRLYSLARKGKAPQTLPTREVYIHSIEALHWKKPKLTIKVVCGKGTYIRQLASDLGEDLGYGAHLSALRRTRVGPLTIEDSLNIENIEKYARRDSLSDFLIPPKTLLAHLTSTEVTSKEADALSEGKSLMMDDMVHHPPPSLENAPVVAVFAETGKLVALSVVRDNQLRPKKVFWKKNT